VGEARDRRTGRPRGGVVCNQEPGRYGHPAAIPPATVTRQRQTRILREKVAGCQELDKENAGSHWQPQIPAQRQQKPDPAVAKANKRLAARFYQFQTGHCLTGQYLAWTTRRPDTTCWWCQYSIQTREHLFKNCPQWKCQQKTLWTTVLKETKKLPGPTRRRDRTSIAELLADERCSQAVLQFFATTDVGRTSGPPVAEDEEDAASAASEWEERDQAERLEEMRAVEVRLGEV